jgi:hypothetical protein
MQHYNYMKAYYNNTPINIILNIIITVVIIIDFNS